MKLRFALKKKISTDPLGPQHVVLGTDLPEMTQVASPSSTLGGRKHSFVVGFISL